MSVIYDEAVVRVRNTQLPRDLTALTHSGSPSPSIQPMVAKRHSLVQRFSVTCLAQFMSLYNWIRVASTKKAPRTWTLRLHSKSTQCGADPECETCVRAYFPGQSCTRVTVLCAGLRGELRVLQSMASPPVLRPRLTRGHRDGTQSRWEWNSRRHVLASVSGLGGAGIGCVGRGLRYQPRDRKRNRLNV